MSGGKLYLSPIRTNRAKRQDSTRLLEYREIFPSVANEMQMPDRTLLFGWSKKSLFAKWNESVE